MQTVSIPPSLAVGLGRPLLVIAGPCQIESPEHAFTIAGALKEIAARLPIQLVYKSSFDKANRTSITGKRGIGMDAGLQILADVRRQFQLPVLTDLHLPEQAATVAQAVDVLQIPAFLCRQTDLLLAAGETGKVIHVKKGQFLHPLDMQHVAAKIASTGNHQILLCERGTSFGYRDLVVDMRGLAMMRSLGYPVVFDATHSVQSIGGAGGSSGGTREFIPPLARAAVAAGIDGIFIECHEAPDRAPSDGPSMLPIEAVEPLLRSLIAIRAAVLESR
jgi:2-dehydro-3-deoxyphosphooctonate aldolase (KDO 8-P synthase)